MQRETKAQRDERVNRIWPFSMKNTVRITAAT